MSRGQSFNVTMRAQSRARRMSFTLLRNPQELAKVIPEPATKSNMMPHVGALVLSHEVVWYILTVSFCCPRRLRECLGPRASDVGV